MKSYFLAFFHRYTFPAEEATVLANLQHGLLFLKGSLVLDIRSEN